jgi:hypothetical protein
MKFLVEFLVLILFSISGLLILKLNNKKLSLEKIYNEYGDFAILIGIIILVVCIVIANIFS